MINRKWKSLVAVDANIVNPWRNLVVEEAFRSFSKLTKQFLQEKIKSCIEKLTEVEVQKH